MGASQGKIYRLRFDWVWPPAALFTSCHLMLPCHFVWVDPAALLDFMHIWICVKRNWWGGGVVNQCQGWLVLIAFQCWPVTLSALSKNVGSWCRLARSSSQISQLFGKDSKYWEADKRTNKRHRNYEWRNHSSTVVLNVGWDWSNHLQVL